MQNAYDSNRQQNHADDIIFDEAPHAPSFDFSAIMQSLHRHLDGHQILGTDWPNDAVYAVQYRTKTWPCGWDKYDSVRFFSNSDELSSFVRSMNGWVKYEDNGWEFTLYMWDLGPTLIHDVSVHIH